MLANWCVAKEHADCTKGDVMVSQCFQSVPIPITRLYQVWVRMVGLASATIDYSPPKCGPLRFVVS